LSVIWCNPSSAHFTTTAQNHIALFRKNDLQGNTSKTCVKKNTGIIWFVASSFFNVSALIKRVDSVLLEPGCTGIGDPSYSESCMETTKL